MAHLMSAKNEDQAHSDHLSLWGALMGEFLVYVKAHV